ncbi:hypothetical protein [Leeuwenhoekiella sp. W20_SRS_FM14]|uniref:hypothetical protein n=1 Tax=Leeuwenhoekiella sp. W20_SRS_FM14 TaxID=3240270 RepID=UPI003F9596EC
MKKLALILFSLFSVVSTAQTIVISNDSISAKKQAPEPHFVVLVPFGKLTSFGDVAIKVTKVVDSRCPSDVICVWAGNVGVEYSVYRDGKFVEDCKATLGAKEEFVSLLDTAGTSLAALSVHPYPKISQESISQKDYIIKVVWKQN